MNTTSADTFDSSQLKDVNNLEVTEIESTEDEFQPKLSSQSIEETITRATATAIAYAEFNQRSDSILSPDNSECGGDDHEDDDSSYFFVSKGQSAEMRSSMCLDENDSIREWEHSRFCSDPVNLSGLPQETEHPVAMKKNKTTTSEETDMPDSVEGILLQCGTLSMSVDSMQLLWSRSELDFVHALYKARSGTSFPMPGVVAHEIRRSSSSPHPHVFLLYSLFATFCKPPPSLDSISMIYNKESFGGSSGEPTQLPTDSVISMSAPDKAPVVTLLCSHRHLLHLPPSFQMSFFRILIRLLSNASDEEYDRDVLLSAKGQQCDNGESNGRTSTKGVHSSHLPLNALQRRTHQRVQRERGKREAIHKQQKEHEHFVDQIRHSSSEKTLSKRLDRVYACLRFRAGGIWQRKKPVAVLLELYEAVRLTHHHLLPPVIALIGLLSSAGVAVGELLLMLQIASQPVDSIDFLDRLLMVKALTTAAEGDSQSTLLVGKASPKYFFTFGHSPTGLSRTISSLSQWPFRNDFGVALWFRCESFDQRENPSLVSVISMHGSGVDVSLMPLENDKSATVLVVTVKDPGGVVADRIIVQNCVLHSRVWYHLGIRHTRSRLKGVFSLSARNQITVLLDGKLMLSQPLKFPNIAGQETEVESVTKSFLSGLQLGKQNTLSLTIQLGANFDGQAGSLYLFNDNVSDATLRALCVVTSGTRHGISKKSPPPKSSNLDHKESLAKAVVELNSIDADEVVMAQEKIPRIQRWSSSVVDLSDADDSESDVIPELSRASLHSKLFLVWDPRRVEESVVLDLHSSAHVTMNSAVVQSSHMEGAKDVIASIGGVQALFPIADSLLAGSIERYWDLPRSGGAVMNSNCKEAAMLTVPALLSMMAAFVHNHDTNAREMMRCGGVDILEHLLLLNKEFGGSGLSLVRVLGISPWLASLLVQSLLDFRSACEHYVALDNSMFSRLLFNLPLWFGGSFPEEGVALYRTLLPVLCSITHLTPLKVRNTIGLRPFIELLHLYTDVDETEDSREAPSELFNRSEVSGPTPLTILERRHVVDVILAMIAKVLHAGATPAQLSVLINYVSFNADDEWEKGSRQSQAGVDPNIRVGARHERHRANVKACSIIRMLLQARPINHDVLSSLLLSCGGLQALLAWVLSTLVNSFDDEMRSIGIRCLADIIDAILGKADLGMYSSQYVTREDAGKLHTSAVGKTSRRVTATFANVGKSLTTAIGGQVFSTAIPYSKSSIEIVYKLFWHLLKCHRARMGNYTHAALKYFLIEGVIPHETSGSLIEKLVVADKIICACYRLSLAHDHGLLQQIESTAGKRLRRDMGIHMVLRLLRFLPNTWKDKWLLELVTLISNGAFNIQIVLEDADWQPSLFHVVSDCLEEINTKHGNRREEYRSTNVTYEFQNVHETAHGSNSDGLDIKEVRSGELLRVIDQDTEAPGDQIQLQARFDLSLQLYSTLLGYCFRVGGDKGINAVELAASLERTCVNGHDVFCFLLNHLISDLLDNGTVLNDKDSNVQLHESTTLLKESARLVTEAILAKGSHSSIDASFALKQWHALRHLAVVASSVVAKSGFGSGDLFDYQNEPKVEVDAVSGGISGIRLSDTSNMALGATEHIKSISNGTVFGCAASEKDRYRRICVQVSAQTLSLLDAFIFPESLDASLPLSQLHGLALVRSNEPRLGASQGPILASLIRLSLVLLCNLEPSSIKCLQCCSRLRCFLHWSLELIRESVALAGYSAAFHELTAPLDRLVLAIVLHCHRALALCSTVLSELELSLLTRFFRDEDERKKYDRRLLRVAFELREIVVTAYRGRNEVLRAALSFQAFEALQDSLERSKDSPADSQSRSPSKEAVVREFLNSRWVKSHRKICRQGHLFIPDQIANGQKYKNKRASHRGFLAINEISAESAQNIVEFNRALDSPFKVYLDDQKNWAETDLVRDLEYDGDASVKRFSCNHRNGLLETIRYYNDRRRGSASRWEVIKRMVVEPWSSDKSHWMFGERPDCLARRILLVRNRAFSSHEDASYELMLGLERERAERDREERRRKKSEQDRAALADLVKRNSAFVPYGPGSTADDEDDGELEESLGHETSLKAQTKEVPLRDHTTDDAQDTPQELSSNETGANSLDEDPREQDEDSWAKSFVWGDMESVVARFDAVQVVTVRNISVGKLLLTSHGLFFRQTGDTINVMTKEISQNSNSEQLQSSRILRWRLSRLREVHGRRFMLRAQAIELFFADGTELFFNFDLGARERDRFYAKLRNSCKVPLLWSPKSLNPRIAFKKSKITHLWRRGKISNFEYLMYLNKFAGRTFNDVTQYPVFPWVLSDYTSETIDLNDPKVYRDLSKPVGALNEERLSGLIQRFNELESFGFAENERFLYGSHYSSPGVVLHFLIRQEPFTSMAIELQSGRFDCPDRLFFDMAGCWTSCMTSTSDVKELIPELFTCPEVLLNTNKLPLGRTQDNRNISDVTLPPWANGSAHEFIRVNRLALESDFVSDNLHRWIDLIFGYKQRGPDAVAAHNVFHYLSYEGAIDMSKITDELERKATESQIQNFGQTPSQLLPKDPHPCRFAADDRWRPLIYNLDVPTRLVCHTPSKQFSPKQARGAAISIHVLTDSVLVVYEDLSVGTYKFTPSPRSSKRPFFFKADKHRILAKSDLSMSRASIQRPLMITTSTTSDQRLHSVGNYSFAVTLGGYTTEAIRRKIHSNGRSALSNDTVREAESALYLLSCGYWDDTVKMHSVDNLKLLSSDLGGHRGPIRCLAMGTDGAVMVTGGQDATCRVWVVDHLDMALALHDGYTQTSLGIPDDSGSLLKLCHVLWGHAQPISCLAVSCELDAVVSGDLGGVICVHTIRRGELVRSIIPKAGYPCCPIRKLVLDNYGTFVVHLADQSLHTHTVNDVPLRSCNADDDLNDIKICSSGEILVTGGVKGLLVIRWMKDLSIRSTLDLAKHGPICSITFTPDDLNPNPQYMFAGSQDGLITVVSEDLNVKGQSGLIGFRG